MENKKALSQVLAEEGVTMSLDEESDSDSDEAKSDSKVSKLKVDGLGGRFFCDKKKPLFSGSHQDEDDADQVPVKTCKDALTSLHFLKRHGGVSTTQQCWLFKRRRK